jgi:hypothetical protein
MREGSCFYDPQIHVPEYLDNLKPHQRFRIIRAYREYQHTHALPTSLDVFPKCDELLLNKCKPRIIWNVPPIYQFLLGPVIRQVTFFMKEYYDGKSVFEYCGQKFTLKFACGCVATDLDEWFTYTLSIVRSGEIDWGGIFLGDDTYILDREGCVECDYSAYDSTQREALQRLATSFYERWGLSPLYSEYCHNVSRMKLNIRYGKFKQYKLTLTLSEPQGATGKPDTCVANTNNNIHATVMNRCRGIGYEAFGLVAKLKRHSEATFGTFLKGFWCQDTAGVYRWNYLPGAMIKLCKTFSYLPWRDGSLETCFRRNLSSIGLSCSPLYRVLTKRFPFLGAKRDDFKMFREVVVVLREDQLLRFMYYRYGEIGTELVLDLERKLESIEVGQRCHHPAWKILASCDYGDGSVNGF